MGSRTIATAKAYSDAIEAVPDGYRLRVTVGPLWLVEVGTMREGCFTSWMGEWGTPTAALKALTKRMRRKYLESSDG